MDTGIKEVKTCKKCRAFYFKQIKQYFDCSNKFQRLEHNAEGIIDILAFTFNFSDCTGTKEGPMTFEVNVGFKINFFTTRIND